MKKTASILFAVITILTVISVNKSSAFITLNKEDMHLWRVELLLWVADGSSSGSNGDVLVKLNSNNLTSLNHYDVYPFKGDRALQPGSDHLRDLLLKGLWQLKDIDYLEFYTKSDDDLCIEGISLKVNGSWIYDRYFGNSTCRRVTAYNAFVVSWGELRSNPWWKNYVIPDRPSKISLYDEINSRIDSVIGTDLTVGKLSENPNFFKPGQGVYSEPIFPHGNDRFGIAYRIDVRNSNRSYKSYFDLIFKCEDSPGNYGFTFGLLKAENYNNHHSGFDQHIASLVEEEFKRYFNAVMGHRDPTSIVRSLAELSASCEHIIVDDRWSWYYSDDADAYVHINYQKTSFESIYPFFPLEYLIIE
jgi:hypothetical protein